MYILDFSCHNCGEHSQPAPGQASAPGEMFPPYNIMINGSQDLHNCIVWNNGGCVYSIQITYNLLDSYTVLVDAKGPTGMFSGAGYLRFIDYSGDHYDLSIFSSIRRTHWLEYMSFRPGIKTILWSDTSF
ncbi:MAG: hypothetical protein WBP41_10880 [Saprospiraceae bacterium]